MSKKLHNLIDELARSLALPLPSPLQFPLQMNVGEVALVIEHEESTQDMLVIHRSLGTVPLEREMEILRVLMDANLFWGGTADATIGVNSETREAVIAYRTDCRDMKPEGLVALTNEFVLVSEVWRRFIEEPGYTGPHRYQR